MNASRASHRAPALGFTFRQSTSDYFIAYDVSGNRERRRVSKLLAGYGVRAQYSVFVCRLTRRSLEAVTRRLEKLELQSGFVTIYPLAARGHARTVGLEGTQRVPSEPYAFVVA